MQQLSPHVQQNMKLLLQLGESFQSIFASDAAKAEVQQLALQLLQHLFITLPHACKDVFIEEICIVDWLLEAARNGKPIARKGVQCLQQHVFNSPAFLQQHHLDASTHACMHALHAICTYTPEFIAAALQPSTPFCRSQENEKTAAGF